MTIGFWNGSEYRERMKAALVLIISFGVIYLFTNHFPIHQPVLLPLFDWEKRIPFLPITIIFYLLTYLQVVVVPLLISQKALRNTLKVMLGLILFHGLIFLFFPTIYPRPASSFESSSLLREMYHWLVFFDSPTNCFPSLHVAASFLASLFFWHTKRWWGAVSFICTILIIISTLTLKQHYFIDIIGGLITGGGAYIWASRKKLIN